MPTYGIFDVKRGGALTVVQFVEGKQSEGVNVAQCREDLAAILREQDSQVLAFDLTGINHISGVLLGLMAAQARQGVEIRLYNPTVDLREVLKITRMDQIMPIHEGEPE